MELEKIEAFIKKYLPSKQFVYALGGLTVGILVLIGISNYIGYHKIFNAKPPLSAEGTLTDAVGRDSNGNGIPDWQETLYGLDPNGDGPSNKAIIEKKQAAANITPGTSDGTDLSATDAFSQQLLATIVTLQQSGTLTPDAVAKVAASVGDTVDAKHTNATTYSMSDLTLSKKTPSAAKKAYYKALKAVVDQYQSVNLGSEMSIIANGFNSTDPNSLSSLTTIAAAYTAMSKQIIALPTPPQVAQNALDLANSTAQMGAALVLVQNIYTDVLTGMVGVDDYTKASATSDAASATLATYFSS